MPPCRWYLAYHPNPDAEAVEPGPAGIDVPGDVLDWMTAHAADDPDVYLLVGISGLHAEISGLVASRDGRVSNADAIRIGRELEAIEAAQRDRSGPPGMAAHPQAQVPPQPRPGTAVTRARWP